MLSSAREGSLFCWRWPPSSRWSPRCAWAAGHCGGPLHAHDEYRGGAGRGSRGIAWSLAWPGSPAGAYAVVGAAAMLGAAMQAPLTGLVLMLELTDGGFGIMVPMIAATGDSHRNRPLRRRVLDLQRAPTRSCPAGSRSEPGCVGNGRN